MRKIIRAVSLTFSLTAVAACSSPTELTVQNLEGTWDASQILFTNQANTAETVEEIALGASLVVTVNADGTISSLYTDPQGGTSSDSGALNAEGTQLTLAGDTFQANLSGGSLRLIDATSTYDFDSDGTDDPATLTIDLVRR